jgi:two-component system response regulator WspF
MRIAIAHESRGTIAALKQAISTVREWKVAWTATDGESAVSHCASDRPDVLLVSPVLPGLDGVEVTQRVMRDSPCVVVVVTDEHRRHPGEVFEAMGAGAVDAIQAPAVGTSGRLSGVDAVVSRLQIASRLVVSREPAAPPRRATVRAAAPQLVAIGASTGGPAAVAEVIAALPEGFPAAVVVVQHVDAQFTENLASWLGAQTRLPVRLAQAGQRPAPGEVALTGSNDDLALTAHLEFTYRRPRDGTFYHPSADVFFESVAAYWPAAGVAALLTGIGSDGAEGLLALRAKGWHTIAQDEHSSVVYGMPRAAVELKAATDVLPVGRIGEAITRFVLGDAAKRGTRGK